MIAQDLTSAYYRWIEETKIDVAEKPGLMVDESQVHPSLFPHQRDITLWAAHRGRGLIAASFGLGKTRIECDLMRIVHEATGKKTLVVCPLGVKHQFTEEDGPAMGMHFQYVRTDAEAIAASTPYLITNYERVRDGDISPAFIATLGGCTLDEGNVLRSLGSDTQLTFTEVMQPVPYRWVATATPSPNSYRELIYYAEYLDVMDHGQALAQPLDAKILTPSGWKQMGQIQPGEKVIAVDGTPTTVLGVFPQGVKPIYKVTFSDGAVTECTGDHLWLTRNQYERANERRYRQRNGKGNDGSRNGKFATVKTTAEIAQTLRSAQGSLNHEIPIAAAIEFAPQPVPVDPYLMGALLGDGHFRQTGISITNPDEYVLDKVRTVVAHDYGLVLKKGEYVRSDGRPSYDYGISNGNGKAHGGGRGHMTNGLLKSLREYDMLDKRAWDKRIPSDYLYNSSAVRLAILQGLMDTDGTIDQTNRTISYVTTSPGLAEDVRFIVRSLGGIATINSRLPHQSTAEIAGRRVQGWRTQYKVNISLPAGINPFQLPRKAERVIPKTKYPPKRYIVSIEPVGEKPAQCIAVEHPAHLYVTDDFVVTHNTRWFKRDSQKAGNLTIHPHHEREFWMWVASWAIFVTTPSDLGYSDEGYDMPELQVFWHKIASHHEKAWDIVDSWGQRHLFMDSASSITAAMKEKRNSLEDRIDFALDLIAQDNPRKHWIVWHHLEDERRYIRKQMPEAVDVYGSQPLEEREQRILDFSHGNYRILATKPEIAGSGCNFQYHCHACIFTGVRYQFDEFIQAIHRLQRFQQKHPVEVHIIFTDAEDNVVQTLKRKWQAHKELTQRMQAIIKEYGLSAEALRMDLQRTIGSARQEWTGAYATLVNNDSVVELQRLADDSVDLIHTSIPFGNHYEYSASYNDFGHNPSDEDFWSQMDFLTPNLLRILKPGRIAAIHVKDRLLYGHQNGLGVMSVSPFSDQCVAHFIKHGFIYFGRITIVTDVVRENNSTYRLGWTENSKDSTKMGIGMPEYLLLFRKMQSDNTRSYADTPVTKDKATYTRAQWQIDAAAFWRSSGNRLLRPEEIPDIAPERFVGMETADIYRWFQAYSRTHVYDYEQHVEMGHPLEEAGRLPATFMLFPPQAPDGPAGEQVWTDIVYMETLNSDQSQKRQENHVCPLPFDIVDRVINRYSNPDELVLDPFGGLMTVPYRAVKLGRRAYGVELSPDYWRWGVHYLREAEAERDAPTLFDLLPYMDAPAEAPMLAAMAAR